MAITCAGSGECGARRVGLRPLAAVRGANRHTLRSHSAAHAATQRVRIQKIRPVAVSIADPKFGCAEGESWETGLRFFKSIVQVGNCNPVGLPFDPLRCSCGGCSRRRSGPPERSLPKAPAYPLRTQHLTAFNAFAYKALTCGLVPPVRLELTLDGF